MEDSRYFSNQPTSAWSDAVRQMSASICQKSIISVGRQGLQPVVSAPSATATIPICVAARLMCADFGLRAAPSASSLPPSPAHRSAVASREMSSDKLAIRRPWKETVLMQAASRQRLSARPSSKRSQRHHDAVARKTEAVVASCGTAAIGLHGCNLKTLPGSARSHSCMLRVTALGYEGAHRASCAGLRKGRRRYPGRAVNHQQTEPRPPDAVRIVDEAQARSARRHRADARRSQPLR